MALATGYTRDMRTTTTTTGRPICDRVRHSCARWMERKGTEYVVIHSKPLVAVAERIRQQAKQVVWDEEDWHYQPPSSWPDHVRKERISLYILALDAINFCFWPYYSTSSSKSETYEYVDLACTLTSMATADHAQQQSRLHQGQNKDNGSPTVATDASVSDSFLLSADRLRKLSVHDMQQLFVTHHKDGRYPPDLDRRCTLWNELGKVLCNKYQGSAYKLVQSAQGSAVQLVQLLYDDFPGFRDVVERTAEDVNKTDTAATGEQEDCCCYYFLKRAQICVCDLQAALSIQFHDTAQLTTFADYRLPQLLRHWNVMEYVNDDMRQAVDECRELTLGSDEELSIRAATVVVVEQLVQHLNQKDQVLIEAKAVIVPTNDSDSGSNDKKNNINKKNDWTAIQVDWYLWQVGERMDGAGELKPHHRVRTIYY